MQKTPYSYRTDPAVPPFPDDRPIIVFDGFCALCTGWAALVLKYDRCERYRLVTAQSELGQALYRHYGLDSVEFESNLLIEGGVLYLRSTGSLRMIAGLGGAWRAVRIFSAVPLPVRDWFYELVARNRLRWFGRRRQCYTPTAAERRRFIG